MTCIVGVAQGGKVWIGGDCAGVGGYSITPRRDEKVFQNSDFLFGFTSSFRMGQVLRYAFTPPLRAPGKDAMAYMVTDFINGVRDCLKGAGFATKDREAEAGGTFLVGYLGRLFIVYDDYQVGESSLDYAAVGCGDDIALGALHATRGQDPSDRVTAALEAAATHSAGVLGPFLVKSIGY
jgi:ATP-dependent protease HslVU (ClpYQ) peptidase subunit